MYTSIHLWHDFRRTLFDINFLIHNMYIEECIEENAIFFFSDFVVNAYLYIPKDRKIGNSEKIREKIRKICFIVNFKHK